MTRNRRRRRSRLVLALVVGVAVAVGVLVGVHESNRIVSSTTLTIAPRARGSPRRRPIARARRDRHVRASSAAVPILMYHVIGDPFPEAPYPGLYVPVAEFAAQIHALAANGFHAVTLDRVWAAWRGNATLPPRPIVITFDNGYRSQYTQALPVLRRLHWVADENLQLTGLPPSQGGLSEPEVRALVKAGWELDTQGYNHADLNALDPAQLWFQVATTRRTLERRYHVPVDWFCYPSGDYDPTVVAAVKAAGYLGSTTVIPGWATRADDPYELPRLRVLRGTSPQTLIAQITDARRAGSPPSIYTG